MSAELGALVPAWDRLPASAPDRPRLRVEPLRRVELDELLIDDDDLPQLEGATVFWAWTDADGFAVRAVRIRDAVATPYRVRAARLVLRRPDPNLVRLLGIDPHDPPPTVRLQGDPRPMETPPRHLACLCRLTDAGRVHRAIEEGWRTVDALKRATGATFGECQGRRCVPGLAARLDRSPADPGGSITPRPPLVPVPASVLAAFAGDGGAEDGGPTEGLGLAAPRPAG
ncbi:MAG TPA: (2Fe-2S)-binding protein [candidate division Zixibacteria bacterium]|nr:(2Fe-2S)-binding protein [candidate division Zixibacteria bacterium]